MARKIFQSTHPARGATVSIGFKFPMFRISIHAPREGCDESEGPHGAPPFISIHAPREGCDSSFSANPYSHIRDFNPRTPRGVRRMSRSDRRAPRGFQSTHPARGATAADAPTPPHPCISIHAPREGCDLDMYNAYKELGGFQSTHPARGATHMFCWRVALSTYFNPRTPRGVRLPEKIQTAKTASISIHAPREGCDRYSKQDSEGDGDFNPRTPRGVRLCSCGVCLRIGLFQSTHPARGATF